MSPDIQEVFNTSYQPTTIEEVELFDQTKSFVYVVFNKVVQTDIGSSTSESTTMTAMHRKCIASY